MDRRRIATAWAVAACAVMASPLPAQARAAPLGSSGLIAFDRTVDGVGRVALVPSDGGAARVLTPDSGNELPVWSADGREIAYVDAFDLSSSDIVVSPPLRGHARRLTTTPGLDAYPAWSPRTRTIAWTHDQGGRLSIWTMTASGARKHRLTRGRHDGNPVWSPDGSRLAYLDLATGALSLVGADGQHGRRLAAPRAATGSTEPSWSPDGREIAFAGLDGRLYAVPAAGGAARALTPRGPGSFVWRPRWSPRGNAIAFLDQARHGALETVDPRSGRRRVLSARSDGLSAPSWSPDGRMLAFATAAHHIEIVSADGRLRRTLTHAGADDADPAWQP